VFADIALLDQFALQRLHESAQVAKVDKNAKQMDVTNQSKNIALNYGDCGC